MSTDALSDVLSAVQLSGSVFFDVTAKSPWVAEAPPAAQIADEVMPPVLVPRRPGQQCSPEHQAGDGQIRQDVGGHGRAVHSSRTRGSTTV